VRGWVVAILTIFSLSSFEALAQEQQNPPPASSAPKGGAKGGAASRKKVGVNFEDQLIEGEVKRPELMSILQKKQYNFGRLIKLRENFLPEMRKTTEAIQRRGGGAE
jgi:hypothetical protein